MPKRARSYTIRSNVSKRARRRTRKRLRRRRRRQRTFKRRRFVTRYRRPRIKNLSMGGGFLPRKAIRKLTYAADFSINAGIVLAGHSFRLNSLFDPDETGVGHQPYGFDQMMTYYGRYTVVGCNISVTAFYADDSGAEHAFMVGSFLADSAETKIDTPQSASDMIEMPGVNYKIMSAGQYSASFNRFVAIPKFFNAGKGGYLTEPEFSATSGSNPTRVAQCVIVAGGADDGDDPPALHFKAVLTYTAIFTEPKGIDTS